MGHRENKSALRTPGASVWPGAGLSGTIPLLLLAGALWGACIGDAANLDDGGTTDSIKGNDGGQGDGDGDDDDHRIAGLGDGDRAQGDGDGAELPDGGTLPDGGGGGDGDGDGDASECDGDGCRGCFGFNKNCCMPDGLTCGCSYNNGPCE